MESERPVRICGAMDVHRRMLNDDPVYRENRARIENKALASKRIAAVRAGTTAIPVVVHVVHRTEEQNVTAEQIASQLDVLNDDYGAQNADVANVPPVWRELVGSASLRFELATTDPDGNATDGIVRVRTDVASFTDNDVVKFTARGGSDAWPADRYLNLWVCSMPELLGYAQFPGGPAETDGVVIDYRSFGTIGTAEEPYHLGRTATHEIGHWLNLYHIWGDDGLGCSGSDLVDDTPNQGGPNTGMPTFPRVTCGNSPDGDMFVNFMDYTDDAGMVMFTAGQVVRMHAALDGPRSSIGSVEPAEPVPEPEHPEHPEPEVPAARAWQHTDLTAAAGAPAAAGDPVVEVVDGVLQVVYRGTDEHIHALRPS